MARRSAAGVSVGRTVTDTCAFNDLPQVLPIEHHRRSSGGTNGVVTPKSSEFCHISRPWTAATR